MDNEKLFVYLLTDQKIEGVLNYPVIKINFLSPPFSFEGIDYLLFTSKNGVRGINKLTDEWKNYPSFAIGKATAKEIEKLGGKIEYIAKSSYGDEFAKEINIKYKNKTFLFFRAKELVSDIRKYFLNNKLKEVIVYETICSNPNKKLKKKAIVIFTSPSTVKCFSKIETFEDIVPIVIGKKTLNEIKKHFSKEVFMPKNPSIKDCVELAVKIKELIEKNMKIC